MLCGLAVAQPVCERAAAEGGPVPSADMRLHEPGHGTGHKQADRVSRTLLGPCHLDTRGAYGRHILVFAAPLVAQS
jgi:hypothetical protein